MTDWLFRIATLVGTAFLLGVLSIVNPSYAHDGHYPAKWPNDRNVNIVFDNGFPAGDPRAQAIDGADSWSDRGDGLSPRFVPNGQSEGSSPYSECVGPNALFWRDLSADKPSFPSTVVAFTPGCRDGEGHFLGFSMIYDNDPPERFPWYFGDGEVPNGRIDFESLATHEFGHATGFFGHFGDGSAECPNGPAIETMCPAYTFEAQSAWRTLENHDIHTLLNTYN